MDDHDMQIVTGLKDPWKFLFVDMDIAMLSIMAGFGLMLAGIPAVAAACGGIAVAWLMHNSRKGKPRGYARHLAYWYLPPVATRLRCVPPVWAHRTVG
ncbi:MAG: type IV conjugative transfer system protein TraL [Rubrivivax sp.]